MPKMTARGVAKLTAPGRYADADTPTLFLLVKPTGARSWMQRLVVHGVRRDIGLGGLEWRSLAEARELARANRRIARQGGDPRRPKVMTFREAAAKALAANRAKWRHAKSVSNWVSTMDAYAYPVLGNTPLTEIDGAAVLRVLSPIWSSKPELGRKVRGRLRTVFAWAQAHALITANPAGESISAALPNLKGQKRHFRALPYSAVSAALGTVDGSGASPVVKAAIRFVVLTACRSGEVRGAKWDEVDLTGRVWTVPAERMKMNREHRVPLSAAAVALLESMRPLRDGSDLIFRSPTGGKMLSDMTLTVALRRAGLADRATIHGMRSSFRTWAAEMTHAPFYACEQALAHDVGGGVALSYLRSDAFAARRSLMDDWSCYLSNSN